MRCRAPLARIDDFLSGIAFCKSLKGKTVVLENFSEWGIIK
jgi:hypothetical protein